VSFYPPKINKRFHAPQFAGEAEDSNGEGVDASFSCGSVVRFSLRIDAQSKEILSAKFRTNGCGFMTAAADLLAEKITGKKLVELHGLHDEVIVGWLAAELGDFPVARRDCLSAPILALHKALADFRAKQIEEWHGEKALICTCFGVAEETIELSIKNGNLLFVDEVTDACNAGGGCGSCQPLIQEI
jgi:NifU-like protein involved in Fe-S cluster formation/bacterioferritin-associated ferredoxin